MDQQLKQRLIGITIVVALAIIFVPMLFEKSDDKGKFSSTGIPAIPDDVLEKNIELPKTAEDISPKDDEEKQPAETGYKMVPMEDEAPPKPKPIAGAAVNLKPNQGNDEEGTVESEAEAGKPESDKTGKKGKKAAQPEEAVRLTPIKVPESTRQETTVKHIVQPKTAAPALKMSKPLPTTRPQKTIIEPPLDSQEALTSTHVKKDKTLTKKPKNLSGPNAKQAEATDKNSDDLKNTARSKPLKPRNPLAKESKPKTSPALLPEADRDLDEEPIPAPAKPEAPKAKAKPKTTAKTQPKPVGATSTLPEVAKKPVTAKPPTLKSSTVKVEKPKNPSAAEASKPPVKPKKPKPAGQPATVKPVQPEEGEKLKPQTMAPGDLKVQVASFTRSDSVQDRPGEFGKSEIPTAA